MGKEKGQKSISHLLFGGPRLPEKNIVFDGLK